MQQQRYEEAEIHQAIVKEVVALTPETWQQILLEVRLIGYDGSIPILEYQLSSPQSRNEFVELSDEIYDLTLKLSEIYAARAKRWTVAAIQITLKPNNKIGFRTEFKY